MSIPFWRELPKDIRTILGLALVSILGLVFLSAEFLVPQPSEDITAVVQTSPPPSPILEIASSSAHLRFPVVSVTDGDTFKVSINGKVEIVRIVGIDTPETVDPRRPVQCFGKEASDHLKDLLSGAEVSLEVDPTQSDRDRYSRLLRFVFLADGRDVGLHMIKEGYAQSVSYGSQPHKYAESYLQAQTLAQNLSKGLWNESACLVVSPPSTPTPVSTPAPTPRPTVAPTPTPVQQPRTKNSSSGTWTCNCSKTCKNLSCAEAQFQLNSCGCGVRDGDNDGIACDAQCQ